MSRVLIDTSTIVNFEKLSFCIDRFSNPNAIIQRHPIDVMLVDLIENVIEAFLFYDEIILDERSIKQSLGAHAYNMELFDKPYCRFIPSSESEEEKIYTDIISSFGLTSAMVSSVVHSIPNDWAPFYDQHSNLSLKGFIKNEGITDSSYSDYVSSIIDSIQRKQFVNNIDQESSKIIYEIVRYLYYIYLQKREDAQLMIHPCRDVLPSKMDINHYRLDWVLSMPNQIWNDKVKERYGVMPNMLPVPFIAAYVLSKTKSFNEFVAVLEDVRNSKEAVNFRKAFNNLIQFDENNDDGKIERIRREFKEAILNWEDNLNIVPGYRYKTITITCPFVSFDVDVPYIGGDKTSRKLLTFIHKTMLKDDDYAIYRRLHRDCFGYRRLR